MKKVILTRQELYDLVWSEPLLTLSKKYNISDVGLRKICIRMNIPLPQNGHWQKIRFGKPVLIKKLPSDYLVKNEIKLFLRDKDGINSMVDRSPLKILMNEINGNPNLPIKVPSTLSNPDKLIIAAKYSLTNKKITNYPYKGVVNTARGELNIRVAPKNITRALRFFDTLIKLLRVRENNIVIEYGKTYAIIEEGRLEISLKEKLKIINVTDPWQSREYHPTGILSLRLEGIYPKEWKDGKQTLEDQLVKILAKLELEGKRKKEERLYFAEQRRKEEETRRIERELKERTEEEIRDFKNLLAEANRWQQAKILRGYINVVEEKINAENSLTDELKNWFNWAKQKADWCDPLINKEDAIIKDVDINNLLI